MGKFAQQIKKFNTLTEEKASRVLRRSALDVLRRVIIRSPVDTGRFRGNWVVGLSQPGVAESGALDKVGGVTINNGMNKLQGAKFGMNVFITNNLPYALRLENGWSQQAPSGMVAVTVVEWPGIVASAVDAEK